jgi:hypothetical protein
MNSVPLSYSENKRGLDSLPWLNQGLLKSPKDVGVKYGTDLDNPVTSLGDMHDRFVEGAFMKSRASNCFLHHHRGILSCSFRNLFGPKHLGGLGATPVLGDQATLIGYTRHQMIIATLLSQGKIRLPSNCARSSFSIDVGILTDKIIPSRQINWAGPLLEDQDVTERVGRFRTRLLSMFSWLLPLGLQWNDTKDWLFLRKTLKDLKDWRDVSPMSVQDYLESPKTFRLIIEDPWMDNYENRLEDVNDYFLF